MPRPIYRQRWAWALGIGSVRSEKILGVESTDLALSALADQGLLTTRQLADFQDATGLADLAWHVSWNQSALEHVDGDLRGLLRRTQGFVVFVHGWGSNRAAWDPLPALVCAANSRLVALVPDLNGFGGSPFLADVPALEQCGSKAIMRTVTHWVNLLGLRSSPRTQRRRRVVTFVGHSAGGAALFHFDPQGWRPDEYARCAIAPTLMSTREMCQDFFNKMGAEAWATKPIDEHRTRLSTDIAARLIAEVPESQASILETARGTLTQTLLAMGTIFRPAPTQDWRNFRVILGHDDPLLDVSQMLSTLDHLGLAAHQVQVVPGTHHLLTGGDQGWRVHLRNRELVVGAVLYLHQVCREQQRDKAGK